MCVGDLGRIESDGPHYQPDYRTPLLVYQYWASFRADCEYEGISSFVLYLMS
jgi:hypothetical protein